MREIFEQKLNFLKEIKREKYVRGSHLYNYYVQMLTDVLNFYKLHLDELAPDDKIWAINQLCDFEIKVLEEEEEEEEEK